jgi:hypothetical protein
MASRGKLLQMKPIMMVLQMTVVGRGNVSNSWRAIWGWPSWQSLLNRERIDGVLRDGLGGGEILKREVFWVLLEGSWEGVERGIGSDDEEVEAMAMDCLCLVVMLLVFWLVVEALSFEGKFQFAPYVYEYSQFHLKYLFLTLPRT